MAIFRLEIFLHFFENERIRNIVLQIGLFLALLLVFWFLGSNLVSSLERQQITTGFSFLGETAGFSVSQSLIEFDASATYLRAFFVGLLNTLIVSAFAILLATLIGFLVGIARLSSNFLISSLATVFIEVVRNIPLLLQLFFWYFAVLRALPHPRQSMSLFDSVFLNKRGFYLPDFTPGPYFWWLLLAGVMVVFFIKLGPEKTRRNLGQILAGKFSGIWQKTGLFSLLVLLLIITALWGGQASYPELKGFNFRGGLQVNPEFMALLLGLSIYTAAYIAEIVRGGIVSVPNGQKEAARALGLPQSQILRRIILPQAFRVIIPPLTNQYLNLIKNSSLAVAIGYPDLTSVFAGIVLNQTGQAVEIIMLTMAVYLFLSLCTSVFMNWFNAKMALVER